VIVVYADVAVATAQRHEPGIRGVDTTTPVAVSTTTGAASRASK